MVEDEFIEANELITNKLENGKTYLIDLDRSGMGNLQLTNFQFNINQLIISPACDNIKTCGSLLGNGTFEYTRKNIVGLRSAPFDANNVCLWESAAGSSDYVNVPSCTNQNALARLYYKRVKVNPNCSGGNCAMTTSSEALVNRLLTVTDIGKQYSFNIDLAINGGGGCVGASCNVSQPDNVFVVLTNETNITNIGFPRNKNVHNTPGQVIATIPGNQLTCNFQTFSFVTPAVNDNYNRLLIYNTMWTPSGMGFYTVLDNVTLVETNYQAKVQIPDGSDASWLFSNVNSQGSTISDEKFEVLGELIINSDVTFEDCDFTMSEGAKITVNNGAHLIFQNTDDIENFIETCDPDKFWDKIHVNNTGSGGGARLTINGTNSNGDRRFRISNATEAISIDGFPQILVDGVIFDRNKNAIRKYGNTLLLGSIGTSIDVKNSEFKCSLPLLDANSQLFYPDHSIIIEQSALYGLTYDVIIGENTITKPTNVNQFYGTGGSVKVDESDVLVRHNEFYDFADPLYGPDIKDVAVEAYGFNEYTTLFGNSISFSVRNNVFVDNERCVLVFDNTHSEISENIVNKVGSSYYGSSLTNDNFVVVTANFGAVTISGNEIYNVTMGIGVYNSVNVDISGNDLDMEVQSGSTYTSKFNHYSTGISVINYLLGTTASIDVSGNEIKHARNGIVAQFTAANIENNEIYDLNDRVIPPDPFCFPFCNDNPPSYGIRAINTEGGYILKENKVQLDLSQYSTSPNTNELIMGIVLENTLSANANASQVNCNKVEGTGIGLRFVGKHEPNTEVVKNSMKDHLFGFVLASNGSLGGGGSVGNVDDNGNASDNRWDWVTTGTNMRHTYADRSKGNLCSLNVQTPINHFNPNIDVANDNSGGSATSLYKLTNLNPSQNTCNLPLRIKSGSNPQLPKNKIKVSSKQLIKRKSKDIVFAPDSAWRLNKQLLYWQLNNDSTLLTDSLWKNFSDSMKNTALGKALGKNNRAIGRAVHHIDRNVEDVSSIQKQWLKSDSLSKADLNTLNRIGRLCPFYDGLGVYQARVILEQMGFSMVVNECELTKKRKSNQFLRLKYEASSEFSVYPNPANEVLHLSYEVEDNNIIKLDVIDLLGRIKTSSFLKKGSIHSIEVSELQPGLHLIRLMKGDQLLDIEKIMIE